MTSEDKAQAFLEGRYTKDSSGGMGGMMGGMPGGGEFPGGDFDGRTPDGGIPGDKELKGGGGNLPNGGSDGMGGGMPDGNPGEMIVGTSDGGTTQSATGSGDSTNYETYAEKDARHWDTYLLEIFEMYADVLEPLFNQ